MRPCSALVLLVIIAGSGTQAQTNATCGDSVCNYKQCWERCFVPKDTDSYEKQQAYIDIYQVVSGVIDIYKSCNQSKTGIVIGLDANVPQTDILPENIYSFQRDLAAMLAIIAPATNDSCMPLLGGQFGYQAACVNDEGHSCKSQCEAAATFYDDYFMTFVADPLPGARSSWVDGMGQVFKRVVDNSSHAARCFSGVQNVLMVAITNSYLNHDENTLLPICGPEGDFDRCAVIDVSPKLDSERKKGEEYLNRSDYPNMRMWARSTSVSRLELDGAHCDSALDIVGCLSKECCASSSMNSTSSMVSRVVSSKYARGPFEVSCKKQNESVVSQVMAPFQIENMLG